MYLETINDFLNHKINLQEVLRAMKKLPKIEEEDVDLSKCVYWGGEYIPIDEFEVMLFSKE